MVEESEIRRLFQAAAGWRQLGNVFADLSPMLNRRASWRTRVQLQLLVEHVAIFCWTRGNRVEARARARLRDAMAVVDGDLWTPDLAD